MPSADETNDEAPLGPRSWRLRSAPRGLVRTWGKVLVLGGLLVLQILGGISEVSEITLSLWWAIPGAFVVPVFVIVTLWLVRGSRPFVAYFVPDGESELALEDGAMRVCGWRAGEEIIIPLEHLELVAGRSFVELRDRSGKRWRELSEHVFEGGKAGMTAFVDVMRDELEAAGGLETTRGRHALIGAVTLSMKS